MDASLSDTSAVDRSLIVPKLGKFGSSTACRGRMRSAAGEAIRE
jgi:hypothetical protein